MRLPICSSRPRYRPRSGGRGLSRPHHHGALPGLKRNLLSEESPALVQTVLRRSGVGRRRAFRRSELAFGQDSMCPRFVTPRPSRRSVAFPSSRRRRGWAGRGRGSVLREERLLGSLRWRAGGQGLRHLGRKTEVGEDAPHHGRVLERGDEAEPAAAGGAGEDVDLPDAAEELGPRRVREAAGASAWAGGALSRVVAIRSSG